MLCKQVYTDIRYAVDRKWLDHVCNETGCKARFLVIDGKEKLSRLICATEKIKIMGNIGEVNSYDLCIRNPIRVNQYKDNSKYCLIHENEQSGLTDEQIDLRPNTRSYSRNMIPNTISTGQGCKKECNIDRFHSRPAGMFYILRPCGIRLSHYEMYSAESLSNVFTYLIDIFGEDPRPCDLKGIVYDRACELHPFTCRLAREGNFAASKYQDLNYLVDIFHVEKHTQEKCILGNDNCIPLAC